MNVHNPDQYMASLRQIIAQGRKRIGMIIGAGAPVGIKNPKTNKPLIPTITDLTKAIVGELKLKDEYQEPLDVLINDLRELNKEPNIEAILSRVRGLASVIGKTEVNGLNGDGFTRLGNSICTEIGKIVNQNLPEGESAYTKLVSWITGTDRSHPVEIFTTNYDLLFEQALERSKTPYFDGFTGANAPFFDPSTVANNDLPSRWVRLWKLHGSLGWKTNEQGEVIRSGERQATHLVFPEHFKYDQTQKAPYSAFFDRLRDFLMTPDTLLIASGFSFSDAHISARIDECLSANPAVSVFAFQFGELSRESHASHIASRRSNMSVFSPDGALINGVSAPWKLAESSLPDWESIRKTYWSTGIDGSSSEFQLGSFDKLAKFFASSRSSQHSASESCTKAERETKNEN